jgi:hypothetical protein
MLVAGQNAPETINFEGIEEALVELKGRAVDCYAYCEQAGESPEVSLLYEMAETMDRIALLLDQFLEAQLFYHIQEAVKECENLFSLRDQVDYLAEQAEQAEQV